MKANKNLWDYLELFHYEDGWWFSHAGISDLHFPNITHPTSLDEKVSYVKFFCEKALRCAASGDRNYITQPSPARGFGLKVLHVTLEILEESHGLIGITNFILLME